MSADEVLTVVVVRKAVAAAVHAHYSPANVRSLSETQLCATPWAAAAAGGPNANDDALLLAFFSLGRPIWPTCMLAHCVDWLSLASMLLSVCACRYLLSTTSHTECMARRHRHHAAFRQQRAVRTRTQWRSRSISKQPAGALCPPPTQHQQRLGPFTGAATRELCPSRRRNFSDFVRSSLLSSFASPCFTLFDRACQHACMQQPVE